MFQIQSVEVSNIKKSNQYIFSTLVVLSVSGVCYLLRGIVDYRIVALLLFLAVSVFAVLYDVVPVIIAAILSAVILNVFFIEPVFHYKIDSPENALLFFMYLAIALVSAILTHRIRKQRKKLIEKEGKENTLKLYETLLNSLSHELRIPITTIIGAADTLKENNQYLSEQNKEELLDEIQDAGFRLNGQVENLLNMSRLESGVVELNKDWTDINELIYLCISKLKHAENHLIQFNSDENLPLFKIDGGLMEQILAGLLQNAVKYSPKSTVISIKADEENEDLVIQISDNGKGFPEDKLEQVFEKFYRLPNSGTGGTGLGLSIVKGFTEVQNGTISLKNNADGGACFTIRIPAETSYLKNLKNE